VQQASRWEHAVIFADVAVGVEKKNSYFWHHFLRLNLEGKQSTANPWPSCVRRDRTCLKQSALLGVVSDENGKKTTDRIGTDKGPEDRLGTAGITGPRARSHRYANSSHGRRRASKTDSCWFLKNQKRHSRDTYRFFRPKRSFLGDAIRSFIDLPKRILGNGRVENGLKLSRSAKLRAGFIRQHCGLGRNVMRILTDV